MGQLRGVVRDHCRLLLVEEEAYVNRDWESVVLAALAAVEAVFAFESAAAVVAFAWAEGV